ncbi:MAG: hypothetical protein ACO307_06955 [Ilumatobacteraceae bacterium]
MIDVVAVAAWMVVLWFGFWIPVLLDIVETRGVPTWVAWAMSPLGPVGAITVIGVAAARSGSGRLRRPG